MLDSAPVAPARVSKPAAKNSNDVTVEGGDPITDEVRETYGRK